MTKKDKVTVEDIIGIVHTDETTNSVEEVRKLRGRENRTEKRFTKQEVYDGINRYKINESNFIVEILDDGIPMHYSTIVNRLNEQHKTITKLKELLHTMLTQIDMENINTPNTIVSARIMFTQKEFKMIKEIWNDYE